LANTIGPVLDTFRIAYEARKEGASLEVALINYDITVAGTPKIEKDDADAHRDVMRAAFDFCDRGIPLGIGLKLMTLHLQHLIKEEGAKLNDELPN